MQLQQASTLLAHLRNKYSKPQNLPRDQSLSSSHQIQIDKSTDEGAAVTQQLPKHPNERLDRLKEILVAPSPFTKALIRRNLQQLTNVLDNDLVVLKANGRNLAKSSIKLIQKLQNYQGTQRENRFLRRQISAMRKEIGQAEEQLSCQKAKSLRIYIEGEQLIQKSIQEGLIIIERLEEPFEQGLMSKLQEHLNWRDNSERVEQTVQSPSKESASFIIRRQEAFESTEIPRLSKDRQKIHRELHRQEEIVSKDLEKQKPERSQKQQLIENLRAFSQSFKGLGV